MHKPTPAEARQVYRDRRFFTQPSPPDVASVRDLQAEVPEGPIALRLYDPLSRRGSADPHSKGMPPLLVGQSTPLSVGCDIDPDEASAREPYNHEAKQQLKADGRITNKSMAAMSK